MRKCMLRRRGCFAPFSMPKSDSGPMTLMGQVPNDPQREAPGSCLIKESPKRGVFPPLACTIPGAIKQEEKLNK